MLRTQLSSLLKAAVYRRTTSSKLIDDAYRLNVLEIAERASENLILIMHGTNTILKTVDFFYQMFASSPALEGKKLILTGAMTPLSNGAGSDGHINLAFSLQQLWPLSPTLKKTNVVLCDYNANGIWQPRLYPYRTGKYKKFYDTDGGHHRIRELPQATAN